MIRDIIIALLPSFGIVALVFLGTFLHVLRFAQVSVPGEAALPLEDRARVHPDKELEDRCS